MYIIIFYKDVAMISMLNNDFRVLEFINQSKIIYLLVTIYLKIHIL